MGRALLFIYNLLAPLIGIAYLLVFFLSPRRKLLKTLKAELPERFASVAYPKAEKCVWIHASSVGEVKALKFFIDELKKKSSAKILITTTTKSGKAEAEKITDLAFLSPLDFPRALRKFLEHFKPSVLFIMETEIWPNMINEAVRQNIPVYTINGRLSPKNLKFYRILSPLIKYILGKVKRIFCQSRYDFERYASLLGNSAAIIETGNIKYDNINGQCGKLPLKEIWAKSKILVCGSVWPQELEVICGAFFAVKNTGSNIKIVIAPRHIEKIPAISQFLKLKGLDYLKWQDVKNKVYDERLKQIDAILVDEMGILNSFYSASDIAFVGGTLNEVGGHNLLEPAVFSKPVLFGPNYQNAFEAGQKLILKGGGFLVKEEKDFAGRISLLLNNSALHKNASLASRKSLEELQGATEKILSHIRLY